MRKSTKLIKAETFDNAFDKGEDVTKHLHMKSAKVNQPIQRINLDMPKELLQKADMEAARIGVTRTSLFKMWIAEHLDQLKTA
jgi:hypothetical protein